MKAVVIAAVLVVSSQSALAVTNRVDVAIEETVSVTVGNAMGWFCDDPTLISGSMVSYGSYNEWVIVGVKEGVTQCRIGTEMGRASYFIEVHVLPRASFIRPDKRSGPQTRIAADD